MKILLLAGNTLRAKAYAQALTSSNLDNLEIHGLLYGSFEESSSVPKLNKETHNYFLENNLFIPDYTETLQSTFTKNDWNFTSIENRDVNSEEIISEINRLNCDIVVFAGYGGQLLKENHFTSCCKYLHMHPGKLPIERGSTTLYYSILNKRKCTVTAFYMTEKIDDGKNVLFKEYNVPFKNVDLDRWFDNVIRADCFIVALRHIFSNNTTPDTNGNSQEYYVIHPVLKHCAILSLKDKN